MTEASGEGSVTREEGRGGMPCVVLRHPSGARATVHLHGAHATSWTLPDGEEMLFVSERARFEPGAAIRGGIPVIFPQFADQGPLPKHGFARTRGWEVVASSGTEGGASVRLALRDDEQTRAVWPHAFAAELEARLGAGSLETALVIANPGREPIRFTCALHTYLRVDDVRRASLEGLRGTRLHDKVAGGVERHETDPAVTFTGETDRVYADAPGPVLLRGAAGGRTVAVERSGFADVVVWNPWAGLARSLDDLGDDDYLRMVCVEPARAARPVEVPPGGSWRGTQRLLVR